jgi:hypothetical protein
MMAAMRSERDGFSPHLPSTRSSTSWRRRGAPAVGCPDGDARGAEFLGRTSSLGRVEPGKDADLVLLGANPIESVQNLHRIHAVVRSGFYRDRDDLDALMRKVESEAAAH